MTSPHLGSLPLCIAGVILSPLRQVNAIATTEHLDSDDGERNPEHITALWTLGSSLSDALSPTATVHSNSAHLSVHASEAFAMSSPFLSSALHQRGADDAMQRSAMPMDLNNNPMAGTASADADMVYSRLMDGYTGPHAKPQIYKSLYDTSGPIESSGGNSSSGFSGLDQVGTALPFTYSNNTIRLGRYRIPSTTAPMHGSHHLDTASPSDSFALGYFAGLTRKLREQGTGDGSTQGMLPLEKIESILESATTNATKGAEATAVDFDEADFQVCYIRSHLQPSCVFLRCILSHPLVQPLTPFTLFVYQ